MATEPKTQATPDEPKKIELTQAQFDSIMTRINQVENAGVKTASEVLPNQPGTDALGKPVGVFQKYSIDPNDYVDPRDLLYDLPEFRVFAFRENYVLDWDVEQTLYDTKWGTSVSEPKFMLTLKQRRFDENGEEKPGLIVRGKGIFFEDAAASLKEAVALGLSIDKQNTPEFLSQMRFLRYKSWIMDILRPRRPDQNKTKIHEEVIAGKVYVIEDYQSVV